MITRALAAEIRHNPQGFRRLLEVRLGLEDLGEVIEIRCEGPARLDLYIEFANATQTTKIGIEAKFDHHASADQVSAQKEAVDHLLLLVVDARHAQGFEVSGFLTWVEVIDSFEDSRLTSKDIQSIPLTKRRVERYLQALELDKKLPEGWIVKSDRGGRGKPHLTILSPPIDGQRQLRSHIQAENNWNDSSIEDVRFQYHLGTQIDNTIQFFPDPNDVDEAPAWITDIDVLDREILAGKYEEYRVMAEGRAPARGEFGANRKALVNKYLGYERRWLTKGYKNWALGPMSEQVTLDELDHLADIVAELLPRWHAKLTDKSS